MLNLTWPSSSEARESTRAGLKLNPGGAHTSRTMMLEELGEVLEAVPEDSGREAYLAAIVDENRLGTPTVPRRKGTAQRLTEFSALDPRIPIFRVLRRLWALDPTSRPLLALLCSLARDGFLRASANAVMPLMPGAELLRAGLTEALAKPSEGKLNASSLDKVARNTASSWCQSGHLEGRVRKLRRRVVPTPAATAFAVWLGAQAGLAGEFLLRTPFAAVLDAGPAQLLEYALRAHQQDLIVARSYGQVVELDASPLDPASKGR